MGLKKDFVWGVATASYQVEGAAFEDGKGRTIWDVYTHTPGKIFDGHNGDTACDHYHRYQEDVKLMKQMGIKAYRFSIDWARVLPSGTGEVNEKGIEFYNNLINELVANDIEPYITLFHWELPYELYKRGGFMNPAFPEWFADYTRLVAERFGDRVKYYFTFNEPQCFIGLGFLSGAHAPGLRCQYDDIFVMIHNVLKAHGRAVITLREKVKNVKIGYAPTGPSCNPLTDSKEDIEAARRWMFSCPKELDNLTWNVTWFSDPVILGQYPEDGLRLYEQYLPKITDEDMRLMCQPLDFYGQNIYNGITVRADKDGNPEYVARPDGWTKTAIGWPVTPKCMYWATRFLYDRYKLPIYITENGMSCHDVVSVDGKVHDPNRIDFLYRYIRELKKSASDGTDIQGYFQWSLMDNFEWAKGYDDRFGLIYVDFTTKERILKDSAYWYKEVITNNGDNIL